MNEQDLAIKLYKGTRLIVVGIIGFIVLAAVALGFVALLKGINGKVFAAVLALLTFVVGLLIKSPLFRGIPTKIIEKYLRGDISTSKKKED